MTACPDENELVLLAEGALEGDERRRIDRHLDGCAECSRLVGHLAKLAVPNAMPGSLVGAPAAPVRYKIVRQIGEGAMGVVWEAEDTKLDRRVALKFVRPEGAVDESLRRRLLREAKALARIRHRNVIAVFDAGEADDEVCLVLELVVGTNARAWRDAHPRTHDEIVGVWRQAAAGIAAVHRAGIVHRDIKPENIMISHTGAVKVTDLGLAKELKQFVSINITKTGEGIGTLHYMSPEQIENTKGVDQRADIYSLGATLYECIAGQPPFDEVGVWKFVEAINKKPPPPLDGIVEGLPPAVWKMIGKSLEKKPQKRQQTPTEFLEEMEAILAQVG